MGLRMSTMAAKERHNQVRSPTRKPTSLTKLYAELNRQFFNGSLPCYRVTLSKWMWLDGITLRKRRLIRLRRGQNPEVLRKLLLHEMCHVSTSDDHGGGFFERLSGLASQGEFWATEEAETYRRMQLAIPIPNPRYRWQGEMTDLSVRLDSWARRSPRPTFSEVLRLEAKQFFNCPPHELRRSVPWLKAGWKKACRETDKGEQLRVKR